MTSEDGALLDLDELARGMPGIPPAVGASMAQAASVCREDQRHSQGTLLTVEGMVAVSLQLTWPEVSDQVRRYWNDPDETTEYGACGVALLLIRQQTPYTVVERSWKGTGFDFWLGDEDDRLFQKKAWLEMSGIRKGTDRMIRKRLREKLGQTSSSDDNLTGYLVIVEFGRPKAHAVQR